MCHCHARPDGLCAAAVCDQEYPPRVVFTLLMKLMNDFHGFSKGMWTKATQDNSMSFPGVQETLTKYQNPREADALMKIQGDMDDIKIVLVCVCSCLHMGDMHSA